VENLFRTGKPKRGGDKSRQGRQKLPAGKTVEAAVEKRERAGVRDLERVSPERGRLKVIGRGKKTTIMV